MEQMMGMGTPEEILPDFYRNLRLPAISQGRRFMVMVLLVTSILWLCFNIEKNVELPFRRNFGKMFGLQLLLELKEFFIIPLALIVRRTSDYWMQVIIILITGGTTQRVLIKI